MNPLLCVKNLKKVYRKEKIPFVAVDDISFEVQPGEILGLLGPNGSGKTTTIQMLLGTLAFTSGSIVYFGKDFLKHQSEILQSVSFASTYTSLPYILNIEENLEIYGRFYGFTPKETQKKVDPLLDRFGIFEKKKERISSLSAGQITRLMLVKAFFTDPKIALLDEPTASLDPDIAMEVCQFLLDQRDKTGISILFTSHKMGEVSEICDRAIFLKNGKIISNDVPKKLAKNTSSHKLHLNISNGLQQAISLLEQQQLSHTLAHQSLQISLDEQQIPEFLATLGKSDIRYSHIRIEEPSLDLYFRSLLEKK